MNGRVWVDSAPPRGATFVFELPIAEPLLVEV
jgi:signal transduction histidine kinase